MPTVGSAHTLNYTLLCFVFIISFYGHSVSVSGRKLSRIRQCQSPPRTLRRLRPQIVGTSGAYDVVEPWASNSQRLNGLREWWRVQLKIYNNFREAVVPLPPSPRACVSECDHCWNGVHNPMEPRTEHIMGPQSYQINTLKLAISILVRTDWM